MPRRSDQIPRYCLHKATGQARVVLEGQTIYLGRHGTEASQQEYERIIGEWLAARRAHRPTNHAHPEQRSESPSAMPAHSILVVEVIAGYLGHVRQYYVKNGRPVKEQANVRLAMKPLQRLYGRMPAEQFGPLALKAVRQAMIDAGWSRRYINDQIARAKRMFKWAVENELARISHRAYRKRLASVG